MTTPTAPKIDTVLRERRGRVALLTLNRPDRLNAWTDELEDAYFAYLDEADDDPDIAAVVVTGAGRGFCAGADMSVLTAAGGGEVDELPERPRPRSRPMTMRKPLIAAINGAAAGLGLVEALYCDVRFAAPTAKLTTSFARRGLIAEYGSAWLLPRLIGHSRSADLLLSGRVILADEAYRIGLVDRVVDPNRLVEEAVAYAADLAAHCSPTSMAVIKEQLRHAADADFVTACADADLRTLESFQRPDVVEGVASHQEKRPPAFPGLPGR